RRGGGGGGTSTGAGSPPRKVVRRGSRKRKRRIGPISSTNTGQATPTGLRRARGVLPRNPIPPTCFGYKEPPLRMPHRTATRSCGGAARRLRTVKHRNYLAFAFTAAKPYRERQRL